MGNNCVNCVNFGMYANANANANSGPGPALLGTDTLLVNDIYNQDGESLGDKLFAVPWAAMALNTEHQRFTLQAPKARPAEAPEFDKNRWPSMSDNTWASGVHRFYGTP